MNKKLTPFANAVAPVVMIALVVAACGATETTSASDPETTSTVAPTTEAPVEEQIPEETPAEVLPNDAPVFVWTETGGCAQAGPNCARYVVSADGTVNTFRGDSTEVAATGTVAAEPLAEWLRVTGATDIEMLIERAGPGELTAAFDGVDFVLEAPHIEATLSSVDLEFSPSEDYFAAAIALASSAADAAPLDFETR